MAMVERLDGEDKGKVGNGQETEDRTAHSTSPVSPTRRERPLALSLPLPRIPVLLPPGQQDRRKTVQAKRAKDWQEGLQT